MSLSLATGGLLGRRSSLGLPTDGLASPPRLLTTSLSEDLALTEAVVSGRVLLASFAEDLALSEGVETAHAHEETTRTQLFGVLTPSTKIKGTLSR